MEDCDIYSMSFASRGLLSRDMGTPERDHFIPFCTKKRPSVEPVFQREVNLAVRENNKRLDEHSKKGIRWSWRWRQIKWNWPITQPHTTDIESYHSTIQHRVGRSNQLSEAFETLLGQLVRWEWLTEIKAPIDNNLTTISGRIRVSTWNKIAYTKTSPVLTK